MDKPGRSVSMQKIPKGPASLPAGIRAGRLPMAQIRRDRAAAQYAASLGYRGNARRLRSAVVRRSKNLETVQWQIPAGRKRRQSGRPRSGARSRSICKSAAPRPPCPPAPQGMMEWSASGRPGPGRRPLRRTCSGTVMPPSAGMAAWCLGRRRPRPPSRHRAATVGHAFISG